MYFLIICTPIYVLYLRDSQKILFFCKSFRLASSEVTYLHHKNLLQKSYSINLIINTNQI